MWKGFNKCYDTQIDYNCYVLPPYYTWYEISDRNIQHLALWTLSDYRIYFSCPQRQGSYEYIPHHSYHKKLLNDFRIAVLFWGCCTNKDKWSSSTYIRPTKTVFIEGKSTDRILSRCIGPLLPYHDVVGQHVVFWQGWTSEGGGQTLKIGTKGILSCMIRETLPFFRHDQGPRYRTLTIPWFCEVRIHEWARAGPLLLLH